MFNLGYYLGNPNIIVEIWANKLIQAHIRDRGFKIEVSKVIKEFQALVDTTSSGKNQSNFKYLENKQTNSLGYDG